MSLKYSNTLKRTAVFCEICTKRSNRATGKQAKREAAKMENTANLPIVARMQLRRCKNRERGRV
jgi:hypothetical protein